MLKNPLTYNRPSLKTMPRAHSRDTSPCTIFSCWLSWVSTLSSLSVSRCLVLSSSLSPPSLSLPSLFSLCLSYTHLTELYIFLIWGKLNQEEEKKQDFTRFLYLFVSLAGPQYCPFPPHSYSKIESCKGWWFVNYVSIFQLEANILDISIAASNPKKNEKLSGG